MGPETGGTVRQEEQLGSDGSVAQLHPISKEGQNFR